MAKHYGLDVKVFTVGSKNVLATFETMDFSDDAIVKEAQAAQDTGPEKRMTGNDFTCSLNKFVSGDADLLFEYLKANRETVSLDIVFTPAGSGSGGATWKTLSIRNGLAPKLGFNVGGEATKESVEITRGTGGDYTFS